MCSGWYVGQTWVPDVGVGVFWEGPTWRRWASPTPPAPFTTGIPSYPFLIISSVSHHHSCTDGFHFGNAHSPLTHICACLPTPAAPYYNRLVQLSTVHRELVTCLSPQPLGSVDLCWHWPLGPAASSFIIMLQFPTLSDVNGLWVLRVMLWISPPSCSTQGNLYSRLTCHGGWLTSALAASTCC